MLLLVMPGVCPAQWSVPDTLAAGLNFYGAGPELVPLGGDSVWAFWVGYFSNCVAGRCRTGGAWLAPETALALADHVFWPSGTVDDSGRVVLACYTGSYPVGAAELQDSWGIYTATRGGSGWSLPEPAQLTRTATFPTHVSLGRSRAGVVGMVWNTSSGGMAGRDSVMFSRREPGGWTARQCLAAGGPPEICCTVGGLVSGDSSDFIIAIACTTAPGASEVAVWELDDSLRGEPALFAGALPALARGDSARFLVFRRADALLASANRGARWSEPAVVAPGLGHGAASLCVDRFGWAWACWPNSSHRSVLASFERGQGWSRPETVVTSGAVGEPRIAADAEGGLVCAWFDHTGGGEGKLLSARRLGRPAVAEPAARTLAAQRATVVRGVLNLTPDISALTSDIVLLDAAGRKVLELRGEENDVSRLSPGVYFVRQQGSRGQGFKGSSEKVVITR